MQTFRQVAKYLLAVFFIAGGLNHFLDPAFYLNMMPSYLPWHQFLVSLSGVCEVALGILVLIPRLSGIAGWGLALLLIAVFPANIYMAMHPELYPNINPTLLFVRLPLQGVLIAWAIWSTRPAITPCR